MYYKITYQKDGESTIKTETLEFQSNNELNAAIYTDPTSDYKSFTAVNQVLMYNDATLTSDGDTISAQISAAINQPSTWAFYGTVQESNTYANYDGYYAGSTSTDYLLKEQVFKIFTDNMLNSGIYFINIDVYLDQYKMEYAQYYPRTSSVASYAAGQCHSVECTTLLANRNAISDTSSSEWIAANAAY